MSLCEVYKLVLFLPVFLALESQEPSPLWPEHIHFQDQYDPHSSYSYNQEETSPEDVQDNSTIQAPPVEFLRNLNNYEVNDLLINFVDYDNDNPFIEDRFGGTERNLATIPKIATCIPELQTVQLMESDDPLVLYIPGCTRIERCGGCCTHDLLSCQPTQTELVNFQVTKTQYTGARKLKYIGKEIIVVERHTKCKCDCRKKAEDCNRFQEYRPRECRCVCTNHDERKKCEKRYDLMLWNPTICACECRNIQQCSTGSYFDQKECRCLRVPVRRRHALDEPEIRYYKP